MYLCLTGNDTEESGWKMVSGDVFRPPKNATSLCVQIGSGVQIITSAFATLFFAALGRHLAYECRVCSLINQSNISVIACAVFLPTSCSRRPVPPLLSLLALAAKLSCETYTLLMCWLLSA